MADNFSKSDINVLELLLKISNDVSSIKTDLTNFKDLQTKERADINKEIIDVRDDCEREIKNIEQNLMSRISSMQTVQNNLVGEVDELKHAEEKKDANKWKVVVSFVLTALGGMILAKFPDILNIFVNGGR